MRKSRMLVALLFVFFAAGCPAPADVPAAPSAVATLVWTGDADLDLEIWSDTGYLCDAADWGQQAESANREGFAFRAYPAADDLRGGSGAHFERGKYLLAVTAWRSDSPCSATLTVQAAGKPAQSIVRVLPVNSGAVWQAARWDNEAQALTLLDTMLVIPLRTIE